MISLPNIKSGLQDAIELIERTFFQDYEVKTKSTIIEPVENWSFTYDPAEGIFRDQARMVWHASINRQIPLVWLTQNHTALHTLTNLVCVYANVTPENIADGCLCDENFPALNSVCLKIASAPLRIVDVAGSEEFKELALSLSDAKTQPIILCDWHLCSEEVELAEHLTQKAEISFCWPN